MFCLKCCNSLALSVNVWKIKVKVSRLRQTLCDPMDYTVHEILQARILEWNSPGKNTGVGSLSLLQGIFPTQESNPGLLHCRRILYQLSCEGRLSYKSLLSPVCDIIIMLGFTPSFCFPCVCVLFFEEVDFSGFLFYFFSFQSIFLICYFNFSVEFLTIL